MLNECGTKAAKAPVQAYIPRLTLVIMVSF